MDRAEWIEVAARHGLVLDVDDFTSWLGEWWIGSMSVDEWIEAVCGCWEDGGTVAVHAGLV